MLKMCLYSIVLLSFFLLTACGSSSDDDIVEEFTPSEITMSDSPLSDMQSVAIADVRRYHFPTNNDAYNLALASQFEGVVYMFSEFFDTNRPLQTIITQDVDGYSLRGTIGQNLVFNPDDPTTYGWFVYSMTLGYLPMWLSSGMEMVARGIELDYSLSALCEMYFAPFSWYSVEHRQALSTAYHFVAYLIESDQLTDIVNLYMTGDRRNADMHAAEQFYLFSGYNLDTFFSLSFSGSAFNIYANTDMAIYTFELPEFHNQIEWPDTEFMQFIRTLYDVDDLDKTKILRVIEYMDDTIMFVKNWYSQAVSFDFEPIRTSIPMMTGIWPRSGDGEMTIPINLLSTLTVHFATRIINNMIDSDPIFPPFEEGVAQILQYLHGLHDRNNIGWAYQYWPILLEDVIIYLYEMGVFESATIANAILDFLLRDYESYTVWYHFLANETFTMSARMRSSIVDFRPWTGGHPIEIHSLVTSRSFVQYLIDTYGIDSYLQVHFDVSLFEYVYGVTIQEMTEKWMEFVGVTAEEFINAVMQGQ